MIEIIYHDQKHITR